MEDSKPGGESDKDKKMKGRFESYSDKAEKADKKEKEEAAAEEERRLRGFAALFERMGSDKDEKEDDDKDKVPDVTESWFKSKESEDEETKETEEEAENALIEAVEETAAEDDGEDAAETEPDETESTAAENLGSEENDVEQEGSPEELTEQEEQQVIEQIVESHRTEVETDEEAVLLDNIKEAGSVEDGYEATLEQLELEDDEAEEDEEELEAEQVEEEPEVVEDQEEDEATPTPVAQPTVQPLTQGQYYAAMPPTPAAPNFQTFNQPNSNPNATTNTAPNAAATSFESAPGRKYQRGADLLVGGIVGYLLGRRRGRINTEERLLPVQRELEKQVTKLNDDILEKENKIRRLVAQKAEKAQESETILQSRIEDENRQEAMTRRSVESVTRGEYNAQAELAAEKAAEAQSMSLRELLEIAANIRRDNISVKEMYEGGRLDIEALRRVVDDYLRGENYQQSLQERLGPLETHERDPYSVASAGAATGIAASGYGAGGFNESYGMISPSADTSRETLQTLQGYQPTPHHYRVDQQRLQAAKMGAIAGLVISIIILIALFLFV